MASHLEEWKSICAAKDVRTALADHFSYLIDVNGFEPVLWCIMEQVVDVSYSVECLVVTLRGNERLLAYAPLETISGHFPAGYCKLLEHHSLIVLERHRLLLGEHGYADAANGWYNDLDEVKMREDIAQKLIVCPIWDFSDCWIYHPVLTNDPGEPEICFLSHEGGSLSQPQPYKAGALFLKRCVELLRLNVPMPEGPDDGHPEKWYAALDDEWKRLLLEKFRIEGPHQALNALTATELYVDAGIRLTSLQPVEAMKSLTGVFLYEQYVSDLTPLVALPYLQELYFSGGSLVDCTVIGKLSGLKTLTLANIGVAQQEPSVNFSGLSSRELPGSPVQDIASLKNCQQLVSLSLEGSRIIDGNALAGLQSLRSLDLSGTLIIDFGFLDSLAELVSVKLNKTSISHLPVNCCKVEVLSCKRTNVRFEDVLHFKCVNLRAGSITTPLSIHCDFNNSREEFVAAVEGIDFDLFGLGDTLTDWVNYYLASMLKGNSQDSLASRLVNAYLKLSVQPVSPKNREILATNAISGVLSGHIEGETGDEVICQLVSEPIQNSRLGFLLACYYAMRANKEKLLYYTSFCLLKKYDGAMFKTDKHFEPYLGDADFMALLV